MYRVLVVDDEPYIADSISAMLGDMEEVELDVYPAYSAFEALGLLEQRKYDIVLSDIQMPGMTGLELQEKINRLWSRCKVIFLTGYEHFDYIQSALKQGASDYILKTDGPDEIKQAIRQVVHQIDHELENNEIINRAKQQFHLAKPMLKKDLLTMLSNEESSLSFRKRRFAELDLALKPDQPLLYVAGQVDQWQEHFHIADRSLLLYAVQNIAEELLSEEVRFEAVVYNDTRFAWFLQPIKEDLLERVRIFAEENIDPIQRNCRTLLHLMISVALHRNLISWEELPEVAGGLQQLLFRGVGPKKEMILIQEPDTEKRAENHYWKVRSEFNKFANVIKQFEMGDQALYCSHLETWLKSFMDLEDSVFTEAYYMTATFLLSCINRLTIEDSNLEFDVKRLLTLDCHGSREIACQYLLTTAQEIQAREGEEHEKFSEAVVRRLNKYMEQHLDSDLSLIQLAEITHFNPQYLSRLYKQVTGIGISDKIADLRLVEAKRLLGTTNNKIQEIATTIGFQSAPYFTRFFKKQTGYTPQEYRNRDLLH